jgi:hypothetical protein
MWKLGLRPRNSQKRNTVHKWDFCCSALQTVIEQKNKGVWKGLLIEGKVGDPSLLSAETEELGKFFLYYKMAKSPDKKKKEKRKQWLNIEESFESSFLKSFLSVIIRIHYSEP